MSSLNDNYPIEPAVLGGVDVGKIDWVIRDFLARGAFMLLSAEMGSGKSDFKNSPPPQKKQRFFFWGG